MAEYGVLPEGFARKPLAIIKAEIEARHRTQFGPDLIQSPQSPMGQINGVFSDATAEIWELLEAVYQSHDADQAEGTQLDTLGRLRGLLRNDRTDDEFRRSITNAGRGSVDVQDISTAVAQIEGTTFSRVYVNNDPDPDDRGLPGGRISVVVEGGSDEEIANAIRKFVAPGIPMFGNEYINSDFEGFCRSFPIVRPIAVEVSADIVVRRIRSQTDCPPPSLDAIKSSFAAAWAADRANGKDVSFFNIRAIIEALSPSVEVVSVEASRPDVSPPGKNKTVEIAFIEIANIASANVTVAEV